MFECFVSSLRADTMNLDRAPGPKRSIHKTRGLVSTVPFQDVRTNKSATRLSGVLVNGVLMNHALLAFRHVKVRGVALWWYTSR